jgi:hypothetical protein
VKKLLLISVLIVTLGMLLVGCTASTEEEKVEDAITGLVSAYNDENYDKCLTYLVGITDENEDIIKAQLAVGHAFTGDIELGKIENTTVNGSTATATVTLVILDESDTSEMTLNKVNGSWKIPGEALFSQS